MATSVHLMKGVSEGKAADEGRRVRVAVSPAENCVRSWNTDRIRLSMDDLQ